MKNAAQIIEARFRVLGVNDDRDFCECCGKTGLKRVVFIEDRELGGIKHFGTTCAMNPAKNFDKMAVETLVSVKKFMASLDRNKWKDVSFQYKNRMGGKMTMIDRQTYAMIPADMDLYDQATAIVEKAINQKITDFINKNQN